MIDVEFVKSCADAIKAHHGTSASAFVRERISDMQEFASARTLATWTAIYHLVAPAGLPRHANG
ncbi:MAG: hypothetical protein ABW128_23805 [Rhizorhabdus sp.]